MPIIVACTCGKKFRANDIHAGKRVNCPGCGTELIIAADNAHNDPGKIENPSILPPPAPPPEISAPQARHVSRLLTAASIVVGLLMITLLVIWVARTNGEPVAIVPPGGRVNLREIWHELGYVSAPREVHLCVVFFEVENDIDLQKLDCQLTWTTGEAEPPAGVQYSILRFPDEKPHSRIVAIFKRPSGNSQPTRFTSTARSFTCRPVDAEEFLKHYQTPKR